LVPSVCRAADPVLASSTLWSDARAVGLAGDTGIVLFTRGLATFDLSDPAAPALLGRFEHLDDPCICLALEVEGNLAYIASGIHGLRIYDFSDPLQPVLTGACDTPGEAVDLQIAGDLAYIADGYSGGLQIIDISDPSAPELLGGCPTGRGCFAVAVSGQYAYCADGVEGFSVFSAADPRHPTLEEFFWQTPYPPFEVYTEGNFLYTIGSEGEKGLREKSTWDPSGMGIYDLTDPRHPVLRGVFDSDQGANAVRVRENLAYIANANATVTVVDLTDPSAPAEVHEAATAGYSTDLVLAGDRAYLSASMGSLLILDLAVPTCPTLLGRWWEANNSYDVCRRGGLACVADRRFGLHLLDLSDPEDPRVLSHLAFPSGAWAVLLEGEDAFAAADTAGVFVIDLSDPQAPAVAGHVGVLADDLAFDGRYLYTVGMDEQLRVIDMIAPHDPVLCGSLQLPGPSLSIAVRGGFGCLTTGSALWVVDLRDPPHPALRGVFDPWEYIHQVSFDGTYAYASLGNNGLFVIDVSDPDAPSYVTELRFNGNTRGSCLEGDRLYLGAAGLQVINVSDPERPFVLGSAGTTGTMHVCADPDLAVTADGGSLGIFRVGPTAFTPVPAATLPDGGMEISMVNPVRGDGEVRILLPTSDRLRLELWDAGGRRAALLHDGWTTAGTRRIPLHASALPSGRYYLRARAAGREARQPVVVLR